MNSIPLNYASDVRRVLASLLLFIIVYLLLTCIAFALAAALVFAGIALVMAKAMFITMMFSLGMIILGVMLAWFMVKFIFTKKTTDQSQFLELMPRDQPVLFEWIRNLTRETGTPMPKRIYLSPEVNAAVFYDSSFFSMFLPVRKNLVIGLGVVNALNQGEFKAIIAHEFGHFSQKSMRWGSYVYHTNKIIYNLLFENEGYGNMVQRWAESSGYFALFGILNVKIVQAFQWVLQKVYLIVNKSNLSLSRQMEHQADAVSAMVCGINQSVTALYKIEIAGNCYSTLMDYYNNGIRENLKPDNIYPQLRAVVKDYCESNEIPVDNDLPCLDPEHPEFAAKSRVEIKDPWATHPETSDRTKFLRSLSFENSAVNNASPWEIFKDPETQQKKLTDILFSGIRYESGPVIMDLASFRAKHLNTERKKYPTLFKGYYNNRRINPFNPQELESGCAFATWEALFNDQPVVRKQLDVLHLDLYSLQHLAASESEPASFVFCEKRYDREYAPYLTKILEADTEKLKRQMDQNDQEIFRFMVLHSVNSEKQRITDAYLAYFATIKDTDTAFQRCGDTMKMVYAAMEKSMTYDEAQSTLEQLRLFETEFKQELVAMKVEAEAQQYLPEVQLKTIQDYATRDVTYHGGIEFKKTEVENLNEVCNLWIGLLLEREFRHKLEILNFQEEIIKNNV
jgi:Zn-dependent protease with chaperone function